MSLLRVIANEYDIPHMGDEEQKIWFFRTKAGMFYHDFKLNSFIALGWDLIDPEIMLDGQLSRNDKKQQIELYYSNEKRPGLILSQLDIFYNKMNKDDLIVIPAKGGKEISIGKLGDIQENIHHEIESEDYPICTFRHKRSVEWLKIVDSYQDIYLFKALRAQQTISDISECRYLILRNLFPVYISDKSIHLMLQKETNDNMGLAQNIELQYNLFEIISLAGSLFGCNDIKRNIEIKTAVGSPGFFEFILPKIPASAISVVFLIKTAIGEVKTKEGTAKGILALVTKFDDLINSYHERKKIDADINLINAQAERTRAEAKKLEAEAELIKAQTAEVNIRIEQIKMLPNGETTVQVEDRNENVALINKEDVLSKVKKIEECSKKVRNSAAESGMSFGGNKIEKVI